jgi:ABC-type lipoprotein release transport system permease subunit
MNFYQFAYKNLVRNRTRTILTMLTIIVSTATLCIVISLNMGYKSAIEEELVKNTGIHIFITREGCPMEAASIIAQGGISTLFVPQDIFNNKVKDLPFIDVVMPFNIFAVTTADGTRTDIFFGVTEEIKRLRPDWQFEKGGWFKDKKGIILGAELARIEKREIGDKLYFEQFDREFVTAGILKRNYTQDDGAFFLPIDVAQGLIGREGKLSAIAVKLKDVNYIEEAKNILREKLPGDYYVITAKELGEGVLQFFGATKIMMFIMVLVAFSISIFGIINTMLMTITERKKEIAYLKCTGAGFRDIVKFITLEVGIISIIGSIAGIIAAVLIAPWFENLIKGYLTMYVPKVKIVRLDGIIMASSFIVVVLTALAASVYPAVKAAKILPMEVLRDE